ncbi:MAG: hypothetical protein ACI86M_002137 [Saprospiraceae bacterium]|jgi:hypothetical protein
MTRIFIMMFMAAFSCCQILAQTESYKPKDLIAEAQKSRTTKKVDFLSLDTDRSINVPVEIKNYELLKFNKNKVAKFLEQPSNELIEFSIPSSIRSDFKLQLIEVDIHSAVAYVKTLPDNKTVKVNHGKHYRGVVKGNSKSIVAISMFGDEIMGFISEVGKPNLVLGKLKDSDRHIVYEDSDLKDQLGFICDTAESDIEYSDSDLKDTDSDSRALTDCVRIYLEVDHDIYQDKGSNVTSVTNFVSGLFNQVATMYANEQINVVLSPLTIWTQPSPYNSSTSSGMLNAFLANTGAFDGDLAQLLSYKASGGIAYVDQLCSSNPDYSKSFSSINPTYQTVPTYSWSVMVMTHEFGHLFGSSHTHACAWNGNNTAIDGCYTTEGNCSDPGIPSAGGTVMSYCHLTSVGINLNLGFGPQPGNLIRSRVTNASCTQACDDGGPTCSDGIQNGNETGVDCGGPDCPACPISCNDTEATLTLLTDNYPGETTWTLKNAAGVTLYNGGPYSSQGQMITEVFCLVDGCYDFTINDSYGDGICCGYGQGSYDISIDNQSVASGGQFNSTETVNFCAGSGPAPTCTDGVQNGNETGVDCGGPDCDPCSTPPTCIDGVQNGNETGVDCGGPDCDPCSTLPTCIDGVQNGNETGVDCGGPDCDPCITPPTCTDGVQNGNETGVDCGGPDCPACESCNDGIQNNGETGVDCGGQNCPACETCDDGIQNGDETGIDCGGQDCDGCETCEDDIQNGSETGIDCGGPDCDACEDGGSDEIFAHYFETGWDGWQDGGSDCYRYTGSRSYEGSYSIRIRDNSGTSSAMTSSAYDLSSYSGVELTFYFFPNSMEYGEDFWLRYYDGNSWQTVATFTSGVSFQNNSFYVATVPILSSQYNMVSNAKFRFQCDASGNADRIYVDAVSVTGLGGGSFVSGETKISKLNTTADIEQHERMEDVSISPNPANDLINLRMNLDYTQNIQIEVIDVLGRQTMAITHNALEGNNIIPINIADINTGTYFIKVTDSEGDQMVERFIKIK